MSQEQNVSLVDLNSVVISARSASNYKRFVLQIQGYGQKYYNYKVESSYIEQYPHVLLYSHTIQSKKRIKP